MINIKLAGVPEHFNYPIKRGIKNGSFDRAGFNLTFIEEGSGTGALVHGMHNKEYDLIIALTEGVVADILKNKQSKIVTPYTETPLIWGIYTASDNLEYNDLESLQNARFAISRFGSGSHIMSIVLALNYAWTKKLNFVVTNDLQGTREAFKKNEADVLLWEKFMTKPLVDSGEWRKIGETVSPWPCFVIAASNIFYQENKVNIIKLIAVMQKVIKEFISIEKPWLEIADNYGLQPNDSEQWFHCTAWSLKNEISVQMLDNTVNTLLLAKVIDEVSRANDLVHETSFLT